MVRILVLCLFCFLAQPSMAGSLSWVTHDRWVTVKKVIDGDTFSTRQGEKVRLLGINTPETQHDTSPAQPFGWEAKKALEKLIAGKQVRLSFDKEKKDRYGRSLAHVYLRDGLWVNADLVRQGLAHVYTFEPNTQKTPALLQIEQKAIQQRMNIWASPRWQVLRYQDLNPRLLGQFRLVQGKVSRVSKHGWMLYIGKLAVSVPKKYRGYFKHGYHVKTGDELLVRGRLRKSKKGQWFLSIHSKSDAHHIK